jgi:hypothetical protein
MRVLSVIVLLTALILPSWHAHASPPSDISIVDLQTQAAQGEAKAQSRLGELYRDGQGVPQNYTKARQWYEKAAAQGYADAQLALGMLYYNGLGVPQDYTMARQWYEQAAAQGRLGAVEPRGYAKGEGATGLWRRQSCGWSKRLPRGT